MLVSDVMTRGVDCVSPNTTLQEAAERMLTLDVGPLPICENDRLVGMITDRDITTRAVARGFNPATTHVHEVMTPEVVFCFETQEVGEASKMMQEKQLRRLLVLNAEKRLVGIVSLADLSLEVNDETVSAEALRAISVPNKISPRMGFQPAFDPLDQFELPEGEVPFDAPGAPVRENFERRV